MEYKYINPGYLESVAGGDKETVKEIVAMFREQVAEITSEMKNLLSRKDYYNLGMLAHKAKSSVAIMGMDDLAKLLKTFELQAKEGSETDKYASYISVYEHDATQAVAELDAYAGTL